MSTHETPHDDDTSAYGALYDDTPDDGRAPIGALTAKQRATYGHIGVYIADADMLQDFDDSIADEYGAAAPSWPRRIARHTLYTFGAFERRDNMAAFVAACRAVGIGAYAADIDDVPPHTRHVRAADGGHALRHVTANFDGFTPWHHEAMYAAMAAPHGVLMRDATRQLDDVMRARAARDDAAARGVDS